MTPEEFIEFEVAAHIQRNAAPFPEQVRSVLTHHFTTAETRGRLLKSFDQPTSLRIDFWRNSLTLDPTRKAEITGAATSEVLRIENLLSTIPEDERGSEAFRSLQAHLRDLRAL